MNNFRSSHRFVAYFAEFPAIKFTSVTGGEESNEVTQVFPGGSNIPVNIDGPTTIGQLTCSKPWDSLVDGQLENWSRNWSLGIQLPLTLIRQPVNAAGIPDGGPETFHGCSRVSFRRPDVTRGATDEATMEIVVQPRSKT